MSPEAMEHFYDSVRRTSAGSKRYLAPQWPGPAARRRLCVDYGCGLGRVTLWLARHCKRVIAVDVSEEHLEIAQRELAARGVTMSSFGCCAGATIWDAQRG